MVGKKNLKVKALIKWGLIMTIMINLFSCNNSITPQDEGIKTPTANTYPEHPFLLIKQANLEIYKNTYDRSITSKAWLRQTDETLMTESDLEWIYNWSNNKELIQEYDTNENYSKSLVIRNTPEKAVGGGLLFYIRDIETGELVNKQYISNEAIYLLEEGKSYNAYVEIFLDGSEGTEIDGAFMSKEFISSGFDVITFEILNDYCSLSINSESFGSNVFWLPEMPDSSYTGSYNMIGQNSEGRSAWRKKNFQLYGGYEKVTEFLLP